MGRHLLVRYCTRAPDITVGSRAKVLHTEVDVYFIVQSNLPNSISRRLVIGLARGVREEDEELHSIDPRNEARGNAQF